MPRDGSIILSNMRGPTLAIVCAPCGRRGRYNVDRLMTEHGDAKLADFPPTLADCPKARSVSFRVPERSCERASDKECIGYDFKILLTRRTLRAVLTEATLT
jgi:hypothetical protein